MRKYIVLGGFLLALLGALVSCTKELIPPNVLDGANSIETKDDVWKWYNGFMSSFRRAHFSTYTLAPEFQADMLSMTNTSGNRGGTIYIWETFNTGDRDISAIYGAYYTRISNTNFFLDNIGNFKPATEGESDTVAYVKAAAHFFRAYYYTELANRFSRSDDENEALCVPLVLKFEPTAKPGRASQKDVYAAVKDDLAKAEEELGKIKGASFISTQKIAGAVQASSLTLDVVKALKARSALYFGDNATALAAATELISSGKYPLLTDATAFANMWHADGPSTEVLMMLSADNNLETPLNMSALLGIDTRKPEPRPARPDFMPTQWVVDMYDAADIRKGAYFKKMKIELEDDTYTNDGWVVNKYPGNPELNANADASSYRHKPKPFRVAELYLIAAEAAYRQSDASAVTHLNSLRAARGLAPVAVSGDALFTAIQEERARELAFEGYRITDLRRWKLGFKRHDLQNPIFIADAGSDFEANADNPKFVWPIPNQDIQANSNLVQNPGW